MEAALDYGVITGGSMQMLEAIVHEVYVPLCHAGGEAAISHGADGTENLEFISNLQKFGSQLQHAIQQMTGASELSEVVWMINSKTSMTAQLNDSNSEVDRAHKGVARV